VLHTADKMESHISSLNNIQEPLSVAGFTLAAMDKFNGIKDNCSPFDRPPRDRRP